MAFELRKLRFCAKVTIMTSDAKTVDEYIAGLPEDRRDAIQTIRDVILKNLPEGYEEGMLYGMIGYYVPHSIYPQGYHCDPSKPIGFVSLASQKNHMALYLMGVYGEEQEREWFESEWRKTGLKLDIGKSCVRFKKLENLPLELIGAAIARWPVERTVAMYAAWDPRNKKK